MPSTTFAKLATAWGAAHVADQMLLALLPLLLIANGASPAAISGVVAAHAAAWLLVSLPVGAYADAIARRRIMTGGAAAIMTGAGLGIAATAAGVAAPTILGTVSFMVAAGVVMIVLAGFALLPQIVGTAGLARSNALLEFVRALVCVAAPLGAAVLVARSAAYAGFSVALVAGIAALFAARALPAETARTVAVQSLACSIREGAAFVAREPLLRAIAVCAIAWNSAFFALTAVFAPYARTSLGLGVEEIGTAWAIYGAGLLLGALAAPVMIARLPTGFMFAFGPALSCLGVAVMVAFASTWGTAPVWCGFFLLGFGPMTWLVLQTSVRQIVTPPALLGRVGAVMTTTIYGVRPLGALAAGAIATGFGVETAMWTAACLFAVSLLAILLSPAARLRTMPLLA